MKTIIFIGTNKSGSSYDALVAADRLQYYTVLLTNQVTLTDNKRLEYPHAHLIEYCDIFNIDSTKECIERLQKRDLDIKAIVSFIEPFCYAAATLAQEFNLKSFSAEGIFAMYNKIESRKALRGTRHLPYFFEIKNSDTLEKETQGKFPLVLKVPTSAGSKDVYKAENFQQLKEAYCDIRVCYPDKPILAEEYLEGPQYLVETVTIEQTTKIIAIIKQEITFTGRFIVTGYQMILDHENKFFRSLKKAVGFIIKKHGLKDGPSHLELRYFRNEWKLIEANPRISGGAINSFIETAFGINLVEETVKLALGLEPNFDAKYKKQAFLQYLIVPAPGILKKVTGKSNAQKYPGVEHVYIKPKKGSTIIPPISMAYRYAYVIATGNTAEQARENAGAGASQIKFHLSAIDETVFDKLSNREKRLLAIAEKNKENIEETISSFDNFVYSVQ